MTQQIFDINEIANRAQVLPAKVTRMEVFSGFITSPTQRGVLQLIINRLDDGHFDPKQIAYSQRLKGDYTVVSRPTLETFYISSKPQTVAPLNGAFGAPLFDYLSPGGSQLPADMNELINRLLNAEKLVDQLSRENEELREELEEFQTNSGRLAHSFGQVWSQFIEPRLFGTPAPMQGTQNKKPMAANQQEQQITQQQLQDALTNIVETFGAEWIVRFSDRIAAQPNVVDQIKSFFP